MIYDEIMSPLMDNGDEEEAKPEEAKPEGEEEETG